MTNIQIFEHSQFGKINVAVIDGKEHFAATECAKALGYADPHTINLNAANNYTETLTITADG